MNHGTEHHDAALAYLLRDPLANRELLLALQHELPNELHVVRRDGVPSGVLMRGPGPLAPDPHWTRIEAEDSATLEQLLALSQPRRAQTYALHREWIAGVLVERYGARRTEQGVRGFALGREHAPHAPVDPQIRLLNADDRQIVERSVCGWSRRYFTQLLADDRHPWAVLIDDTIVSRASTGYLSGGCEEVVGVWTHPRYRGRGLARRLVAAVAGDILGRHPFATYSTTLDNRASQRVALAVGFQPTYEARVYTVNDG